MYIQPARHPPQQHINIMSRHRAIRNRAYSYDDDYDDDYYDDDDEYYEEEEEQQAQAAQEATETR